MFSICVFYMCLLFFMLFHAFCFYVFVFIFFICFYMLYFHMFFICVLYGVVYMCVYMLFLIRKINLNAKIELQISQSNDSHIINPSFIKVSITHSRRIRSRHRPIRGGALGHDQLVL